MTLLSYRDAVLKEAKGRPLSEIANANSCFGVEIGLITAYSFGQTP